MKKLHGATWETAPVDSILDTGARVADALAHVHEAWILHRDVKPANSMICADGRVVLMDFCNARNDASDTRTVTAPGMAFGTPAYMAPEQIQGQPASSAADLYALGLVLVEKLTGHRLPADQLTTQVRIAVPAHVRALLARMTAPRVGAALVPASGALLHRCHRLGRAGVEPLARGHDLSSIRPARTAARGPTRTAAASASPGATPPRSRRCWCSAGP
ncbi:protein kinase [Embleya sp. NPDC020630]|uniref:protein kinase domain-containing protein n=1 Tax=Embleya sp. NPDC020630 TaxID=3363979 RepID=UPI0037AF0E7C